MSNAVDWIQTPEPSVELTEVQEALSTDKQLVEYSGFWKRVLAYMCDSWFNALVIPMFVSIYYYYKDGQTLGYKVMGLSIKNSLDEWVKPGGRRLFWRRLAKWYGLVLIVAVIRFLVSLVFYRLWFEWWSEKLTVIRSFINWWLWIISLLWLLWVLFVRIPIPFSKKNKWVHDMIAKTEVWKVWEKKIGWLVVWIILFVIWIIFWVVTSQSPWVADLYQITK